MDSGALRPVIVTVLLQLLLSNSFVVSYDYRRHPSAVYTYDSFHEVKRRCVPMLPVIAELKPDDTRGERIKNELSFDGGVWGQEPDASPLIPAGKKVQDDDRSDCNCYPSTKLVSFWVTDVDSRRRSDNMVSVSGLLDIGMTKRHSSRYGRLVDYAGGLRFTFEGIYVESDENGGERHLCMLGASESDISLNHVPSDEPLIGQDGRVMLLLRYPKTFTLTSRVIYGEMESLAIKSDLKYFDKISIFSQLSAHTSGYQFGSAQLSTACSSRKDLEASYHEDSVIFRGKDFCNYLQGISGQAEFKIIPNHHKSFERDALFASFVLQNQPFNFKNLKLVIRNFICRPGIRGTSTANVSAEFAVFSDDPLHPMDTSGMSSKSLFAEGIWSFADMELCMVGCLGRTDVNPTTCDYRVSVVLPNVSSIHRRSLVYGSITDANTQSASDATISFEIVASSLRGFVPWPNYRAVYNYSKISLTTSFKSRHWSASLVNTLRRILLEYPSPSPNGHGSLSDLSRHLTVQSSAAVLKSSDDSVASECSNEYEARNVLSVYLYFKSEHIQLSPPAQNQAYSEISDILTAGYLSVTGRCFSNVSLSVEGLYDSAIGAMHLMGCKDVRGIHVENVESLEQGHDCMIKIEVDYPPTNVRWFLNQKLKISINSQREKLDSLYFDPIVVSVQSFTYPWQSSEKQFIMIREKQVMITLMVMALTIISYQFAYMKTDQGESNRSYISLVMLSIQASSYLIPFITGSEVADSFEYSNSAFSDATIIYGMMLQTSVEFFRLASRVRASRRTKPNSANDFKVLIITLSIHVLGLSLFLNDYYSTRLGTPLSLPFKQIEAYWGVVLDLFLLPQIIANRMGRIKSKPLCKIYYIGFSFIRAFPHLYNYFRDPVYDTEGYVAYDSEHPSRESQVVLNIMYPNRLSELVIGLAVISLAFDVYIQQRRNSGSQPEGELPAESENFLDKKDSSN